MFFIYRWNSDIFFTQFSALQMRMAYYKNNQFITYGGIFYE